MLHKKLNLSSDDVRERYEHFRDRCTKKKQKTKKQKRKKLKNVKQKKKKVM